MTPHRWVRLESESNEPEIFWVRCTGCGATVVTNRDNFPDSCNVGYVVPVDCDVTIVEMVTDD